jgi:LIVCS family branched-chain amino acid:cation transporter
MTTIICCLIGIGVGQMNVKYIIDIALPVLMFIYPLCIVLILLNVIPEQYASKMVFRWTVLITFVFSIPDFLGFVINKEELEIVRNGIPLANQNLGWVVPSILAFLLSNVFQINKTKIRL